MISNTIVARFTPNMGRFRHEWLHLHSAMLQPERLPRFVQECPSAMRILDLIGSIAWDQFPERNLIRDWGRITIPYATFSAACLLKLNEGLVSMDDLRQYLVEHPAFIWLFGFPLMGSSKFSWGFDPFASLPTQRHLTRVLRIIPNQVLQFLLA